MTLSQTQYDEIMRTYETRREHARHKAEEAKRKVRLAIPEYVKIENSITDLAMERAQKALDGDTKAVAQMKAGIEELVKKQEKLLADNGFAPDCLEEKYECPDCKDTGYIDGNRKCHCLIQAMIRYTYRQSNIEEILQRENFDTLSYDHYTDGECEKMKDIIASCRNFADDFGNRYENILLLGNVGVGKTFLTNCMAKTVLDKGYSVIYFTSIRLFDTLSREVFGHEETRSADILHDIFTCDLLIIDDLGTENVNSFVASRLFDIINERDLRRRPTIISTNLTFEELDGRYTERNFSRIFAKYTILHPDIGDLRIRMRRQSQQEGVSYS
ncbi:MAG: ATP-binding protein [Lachnospiraceae bacterium]|nr:ATP-binding protein [Lachnospiraceae bacterium]